MAEESVRTECCFVFREACFTLQPGREPKVSGWCWPLQPPDGTEVGAEMFHFPLPLLLGVLSC